MIGAAVTIVAAGVALVAGLVFLPGVRDSTAPEPASSTTATTMNPPIVTAPDSPRGRRIAMGVLAHLPKGGPNETVEPDTARVAFSWQSRFGEYTIWRASTQGRRGAATLFSSPRVGYTLSYGVERRLPSAPYVFHVGGGAWPPRGVRELYGRASSSIARVQVRLKNGALQDAALFDGWWVFTQDIGNAKPVALVGSDPRGRVIVRNDRPIF